MNDRNAHYDCKVEDEHLSPIERAEKYVDDHPDGIDVAALLYFSAREVHMVFHEIVNNHHELERLLKRQRRLNFISAGVYLLFIFALIFVTIYRR